jgi:predicted Zn finger-like uncharacterized protein
MKFSCERCQTRYSIGEDKVKGKVLKIRCKTCGNIIVVREQQVVSEGAELGQLAAAGGSPAAAAPSTAGNAGSAAAPAGDFDWYLAIKGKQHGPAKRDEVIRLFRDGKITERTHLWHDKLAAWTRLKDLPEFAAVVAEGPGPRRPPPPPTEEGAEIVNFEAARAQRSLQQGGFATLAPPASTAAEAVSATTNDPFAAVAGAPTVDSTPRESTRVFIMNAGLHNRQAKQRMYAGIAILGVVGFVGLCIFDYRYDVLGLKRVVETVAEKTGIMDAPPEEVAWGDDDADPTLRCQLMPDPAACVREVQAERARNPRRRPGRGGNGSAVSDADLAGAFGGGPSGGGVARVAVDEHGEARFGGTVPSADEIKRTLGGGKGGPSGPSTGTGGSGADVAKGSIDAETAAKVVRDGQSAIQVCVEDAMKRGEDIPPKVVLSLNIETNGLVSSASVTNAVVKATDLGGCLGRVGRKWKFPPTTEAATLEVPLLLR